MDTGNAYAERLVRLREGGPTLRAIAMTSATIGWAVGDEGTVLKTDNGGRSWVPVRLGFSGSFRALAVSGTAMAVAGLDGLAGVSTDSGATWRRLTDPILSSPSNHWNGVAFAATGGALNPNHVHAAARLIFVGSRSSSGGIIARENNGPFTQALTPGSILNAVESNQLSPTTPARVMAVGDAGLVAKSSDGGIAWTTSTVSGGALNLRSVAFGSVNTFDAQPDVWVVGDSGLLLAAASFDTALGRVFGPTLENFTSVRVGYIVGENGSAYTRLALVQNPPFVRENPSAAYDFTGQASSAGGRFLVGQFGQIYFRPFEAPAGPFLTFAPGAADFGILPLNRTRTIEVTVFNRGVAPLHVTGITRSGSSAFSLGASQLLNIGTNSSRTFRVNFTPTTQGDHTATIELAHNESTTRYRLTVTGRGQVNTWNILAGPSGEGLRDVQFVSDSTGFTMTLNDIFKTTTSGTTWAELSANPPGNLSRLHFFSSSLGFAFGGEGGRLFPPCTNTCASFILRTADGGTTWSTRSTGVSTPVDDLQMATSTTGFAVTRSAIRFGLGGTTPGEVLRTTDGGLTWTVRTRPAPLTGVFNGSAIHAISSTTVFATGNGELFRSTDGGLNWTRVLNLGGSIIEDIQFLDANNGWIVGQAGLFRRTTTGGTVSTAWTPQPAFTSANLKRVHFISTATGWTVGDNGVTGSIFRTDNGGVTWLDEFREDIQAGTLGPGAVSGRSTTLAFAVNGQAVYRGGTFNPLPQGSPVLPSLVDFGVVSLGGEATRTVTLRNVGNVPVSVSSLTLDDDTDRGAFQLLTSGPLSVPANGAQPIIVKYTPRSVARHHARLVAGTDGYEKTITCDLVGEAEIFPTTIVFETVPPGLQFTMDNRSVRGPIAITVVGESKVPNDVINLFQWRFGTVHTISAPPSQVKDGYEYRLQGWEPSQPETFSVLATNVPATYRAVYVPIKSVTKTLAGLIPGTRPRRAVALAGNPVLASAPTDVPGGPYIRVSNARLEIPALGNLEVQGSAFLSSDRFEFALESDPIGDPKLLSVDAGSWRVNFTNDFPVTRFVLRAQSPGITLLNKPVTGSSEVLFDVTATRIVAQVTATSATPIIPAIAELAPNTSVSFTNVASGNTRFSSLRTSGQLRLLAKPGGGFAINQSFNFFASDGPFTNSITAFPATILDAPLLRVTPGSNARLEVRRTSQGVYGVGLANFNLSLLGGANTTVSASLSGTRMNFTTSGNTIAFGQLRYEADAPSSIEWNFDGPSIRATLAAGTLEVPLIGQDIDFAGFTIDSNADFDRKIALPALTFDGIGISAGGPLEHNFVRFYRADGVTGFQLRDRRSFFDNTFRLKIDINTAGRASGSFSGNLSIKDFLGCEEIGVGEVNISYDSDASDGFQFKDDVRLETCLVGTHDFRIKFGSAGARFCHLICGDNGCSQDVCIP
ncbi:MAG: choice-of-anchor D domain-containing protein [Verrucomicrobiales bacterium]|nr:choice-of-anchor D domain-containing protein [Verrucomicrobiales bacterium]